MLGLSWYTFRQRWSLFAGAIASLTVGVALIVSAVQIAASATPPDRQSQLTTLEWEQLRTGYEDVATLMILTAILAGFLTVFIVATTFAFTVTQRRRDLALLRLVGVGRSQIRRLLLGEAILLGATGAIVGVPLARPLAAVQMSLVRRAGFLPDGFTLDWRTWPSILGMAIGLSVAVLGVLSASRRAARIAPLEALRHTDTARNAMSGARWVFGLGLLALTASLVALATVAGLVAALALSLGVTVFGGIALSLVSPLVVPLASRALGLTMRASTIGTLAAANVRHAAQRSASTAAPLIVLVALVVGLAGTLDAVTLASEIEQRDTTVGDIVINTTGRHIDRIVALPGVAVASSEITAPLIVDIDVRNGDDSELDRITAGIVAVDPDTYQRIHPTINPIAGTLDDLTGPAIAVTQRTSDGDRLDLGQQAIVDIASTATPVRLVAARQ